ncbi:metal ABC transporter solute-binding protein, Zn/Mn family [Mobiluncus sp.]|uniref:metal ABC transporter solute-binding protein, Zn/Mn family n=1 Tax=Mobiluncus sp. TaxID=47293 RepID=UPI002A911954|nr:zinc ABC transporter substrate-binding protein [Mobiluncus sp.]MDY6076333.1 zinc ABC transporter substrate-binding protein [Mobiluncus sp.]
MKLKTVGALFGAAALAVSMTACSTANEAQKKDAAGDAAADKPTVYASTDVWASVAKAVVGDKADVITSIDQPNLDPHSYEASVKDKKLVNQASVVIVNGGGYDDWALQLAKSADNKPTVLNAVELAGIDCGDAEGHDHEDGHEHEDAQEHEDAHEDEQEHEGHHHHHCSVNEHVFYDLHAVSEVAKAVANTMSQTDGDNAAAYQDAAKAFQGKLDELESQAESIKARGEKHSLATEPLANYMLEDAGIHDLTPEEYVEQSETESGPSVKTQADTKALITEGRVDVLLVNSQTQDPVSQALQDAAETKGIPVVTLTETLAGASDYVSWIGTALDQIDKALK